jgi:hypothetical protein
LNRHEPQSTNQQITPAPQTGLSSDLRQIQAWTDPDWQRLWLTLDRMPWRTLALIPAGVGAAPDFTLTLAVALSRTGMSHVGSPILVADGTQVPLNQLTAFLADVRTCRDGNERVIIALSAAAENPTNTAMAKDSDAVVMCVMLGKMKWSEARRTVKTIGPNKFVGSVIVRSDGSIAPPPPK